MGKSKIEWCDRTWNPVVGCTQISPGCANCYAKRMSERFAGPWGLDPKDPFKVTLKPERMDEPGRWKKPAKVFVCSMSDLFHDDVPFGFIHEIWDVMKKTPQHTFLILTKRPERMKEVVDHIYSLERMGWSMGFWNHVWLGVTSENQEQAGKRIPVLLQISAAKRFVSVEPMLGPVNITPYTGYNAYNCQCGWHETEYDLTLAGAIEENRVAVCSKCGKRAKIFKALDWTICGGESGPGARPMHPDWARSLRDQCKAAGTPFMFKQWGEWAPFYDRDKDDPVVECTARKQTVCRINLAGGHGFHGDRVVYFQKVGKKISGRLLDGEMWGQYPADV